MTGAGRVRLARDHDDLERGADEHEREEQTEQRQLRGQRGIGQPVRDRDPANEQANRAGTLR